MFEIWVEEAGKEFFRQTLSEGQFTLGRVQTNDIPVPNRAVSRQHLRIEVASQAVLVTDLGSTNGTQLNGRQLVPNQTTAWSPTEELKIGDLTIHLLHKPEPKASKPAEPASFSGAAQFQGPQVSPGQAFAIVGAEARPQMTPVTNQPIVIGSAPSCAVRVLSVNVANQHCLVQRKNGQIEVTNLDFNHPAALAGVPLNVGQAAVWPVNQVLQVGNATLVLTQQAAAAYSSAKTESIPGTKRTLRLSAAALIGGLVFVCFLAAVIIGIQSVRCGGLDASCIIPFGSSGEAGGDGLALVSGRATPTLASRSTGGTVPTLVPTVLFDLGQPTPTSVPVDCAPESSSQAGWLDLPFPYQGIEPVFGGGAETFRRISQRSRFGGRINSFFDHEFPVYPPIFGGREPDNLDDTLVIFNGERTADAYSQDTDSADWYSGHSGIDFAPAEPREPTTPILAAADGRLVLAKIDKDDNHMVWLEHDPDGDGRFQYATLYFHLHPDAFFEAMVAMEENTPIAAGQRIGTMGTTGRSSGIHLHFEVREDINRDGTFSIFERVDPYGWFPSQEISDDPWAILAKWIDSNGDEIEHDGIRSDYLWVHPLVDVVDQGGKCQQVTNVKIDLYNVLGYAVVDPGFTYIARSEAGDVLEVGQAHRRTLTILEEEMADIDPTTLSLEWLNPKLDTWFTYAKTEAVPRPGGGYTFSAIVEKTGRYVLVAKEVVDRVPPATAIELDGELVDPGSNTYKDSLTVTLEPRDRGLILSDIKEVQYSLDCGQTWQVYSAPFEVTLQSPHSCGGTSVSSQTIELDQNDFLLLAMSEDSENNIEQPPAQMRFRIE